MHKNKLSLHRSLFVGPMSKNIVDAIIENDYLKDKVGLIPSRRQVDCPTGYVNNWSTKQFLEYTQKKNLVRCRDHSGPSQGQNDDDGIASLSEDCNQNSYFDIIHIDPWKKYSSINDATAETCKLIRHCLNVNKNVFFEIGTEAGIRSYNVDELHTFLKDVKESLGELFNSILYCVVQGGTLLSGSKNAGVFDEKRLSEMVSVCKDYKLLSKEHNGDYLNHESVNRRFQLGLNAINVAPELGYNETSLILSRIGNKDFESFFSVCYESGKWKKWLPDFKPTSKEEKLKLVEVSGHYNFSNDTIKQIIHRAGITEEEIKQTHVEHIRKILVSTIT